LKTLTTIPGAARYFQQQNRYTAITAWGIRQYLLAGKIPYTRRGRRYIVAVEDVAAAYSQEAAPKQAGGCNEQHSNL